MSSDEREEDIKNELTIADLHRRGTNTGRPGFREAVATAEGTCLTGFADGCSVVRVRAARLRSSSIDLRRNGRQSMSINEAMFSRVWRPTRASSSARTAGSPAISTAAIAIKFVSMKRGKAEIQRQRSEGEKRREKSLAPRMLQKTRENLTEGSIWI